jgi:carboxypeptidase Taq
MNTKIEELKKYLGEFADLSHAAAILSWDQQTYMPPGAAEARAAQLTTLRKLAHERLVSDEVGRLLEELAAETADLDPDSYEASLVRVTRRKRDREVKLPTDLVARLSRARALGHHAWEQARAASDFYLFLPHLEELIGLAQETAEALGYEERPYDALLDRFEPELKTSQVEALFAELKAGLVPLVRAIAERQDSIDDSFLCGEFDVDRQWAFGLEVVKRMGYDLKHGRQDRAAHPFTTSFTPADVRITTRVYPDQLKPALFATIHEAGHALYEQGISRELTRSPLGDTASLGVHESQSRMWENIVGRSRGFWSYWLPRLRQSFEPQLEGVGDEAFYRAINRVQPSLIRVEADEVTYNLHIFLRFEMENLMLEGKVRAADLPELWNAKMVEFLGVQPPNDALGVLQDVHWSSGLMGYFPTYTLGNLLSAQFYRQAVAEVPAIPEEIERGEYASLLGWMRERIHCRGAKDTPAELVQRITGGPMRTEPFLEYVRTKYRELYGLED